MGFLPAERLGRAPATAVATEMAQTFPSLRFGLLVGVGGGVPTGTDVRLGQIVVSLPDRMAQTGWVVQYDYGKAVSGGCWKTWGCSTNLLSAIGKVKSAPRKHSQFRTYLESEDFKDEPEFAERPEVDRLFEASHFTRLWRIHYDRKRYQNHIL